MRNNRTKVVFYTLGCRLNQAETAVIIDDFSRKGYEVVASGESADVCIINSCTVTKHAETKCRHLIRRVLRQNPNVYIAITGCYAQMAAKNLQSIEGVRLIVGTEDKLKIAEFVDLNEKAPSRLIRSPISRKAFSINGHSYHLSKTRANLKIQDGCDFMCSFCIIPFARGRARSRAFEDIRREALELIDMGYKELVITGINIATYNFVGKVFTNVVEMLLDIRGLQRLRISSIEPTTIARDIFDIMATTEKLCPHLHIPLQSGCNQILTNMKRNYRVEDYLQALEYAVSKVPNILLATDIMVGFPGEDEQSFATTCKIFQEAPLAYAHVFSFSPRQHTAATRLANQVPATIKKQRSRKLQRLSQLKKQSFYQRFVGTKLSVLLEEQDSRGHWLGFAANYVKVAVQGRHLQANQIVEVSIHSIVDGVAQANLASASEVL